MLLFFQPEIANQKKLDSIDSKHCIKVLRRSVGDEIWITDGKGNMYHCKITDANHKSTAVEIIEHIPDYQKPSRKVMMAIAPTKNTDRIEYFVEKGVEIGVSEIYFFETQNSERKILKTDRIERIAISAMKQSLKAYLPVIHVMVPFKDFIKTDFKCQKLIAHLSEVSVSITSVPIAKEVLMMVGPEGDFTLEEIVMAKESGFQEIKMGTSRLRTETAGVVALTMLNLLS